MIDGNIISLTVLGLVFTGALIWIIILGVLIWMIILIIKDRKKKKQEDRE